VCPACRPPSRPRSLQRFTFFFVIAGFLCVCGRTVQRHSSWLLWKGILRLYKRFLEQEQMSMLPTRYAYYVLKGLCLVYAVLVCIVVSTKSGVCVFPYHVWISKLTSASFARIKYPALYCMSLSCPTLSFIKNPPVIVMLDFQSLDLRLPHRNLFLYILYSGWTNSSPRCG
jgi:hypothetical protein